MADQVPTKFKIYNKTSGRLEIPALNKVLHVGGWFVTAGPVSQILKNYAGKGFVRIEELGLKAFKQKPVPGGGRGIGQHAKPVPAVAVVTAANTMPPAPALKTAAPSPSQTA